MGGPRTVPTAEQGSGDASGSRMSQRRGGGGPRIVVHSPPAAILGGVLGALTFGVPPVPVLRRRLLIRTGAAATDAALPGRVH